MAALTLAQAKEFLRYDGNDQDETISLLLSAAQEWVERYTGIALTQRQFVQAVGCLNGPVSLDWWPVSGTVTLAYLDSDGIEQEYTDARLVNVMRPASVYPALAGSWPVIDTTGANAITYTAGYADPDDIPAGLLHAMLVYAGMSDAEREGNVTDTAWNALHALIAPYRAPGLA